MVNPGTEMGATSSSYSFPFFTCHLALLTLSASELPICPQVSALSLFGIMEDYVVFFLVPGPPVEGPFLETKHISIPGRALCQLIQQLNIPLIDCL